MSTATISLGVRGLLLGMSERLDTALMTAQDAEAGAQIRMLLNALDAAEVERDRLRAVNAKLVEALRQARQFIENGIEGGFIRMPDDSTPDPAHDTLPAIIAAIAKAEGKA